jgi:hypothetical protein
MMFTKAEVVDGDIVTTNVIHDTISNTMNWLKDASTVQFDKFLDYWNPKLDGPSRVDETLAEIRDRNLTVNRPQSQNIEFWNRHINEHGIRNPHLQGNQIRVLHNLSTGDIRVHPQAVDDYYVKLNRALARKRIEDAEALEKSKSQANVRKLQKRAFQNAPLPPELQSKIFGFLKPNPNQRPRGVPIREL